MSQADYLLITCSANCSNEKLINRAQFLRMKKSMVLVNVARGSIIDQEALYHALKEGLIRGAGNHYHIKFATTIQLYSTQLFCDTFFSALDVTTPEPLPLDHKLHELGNCFVTPHVACQEESTRRQSYANSAINIVCGLIGRKLINQVGIN